MSGILLRVLASVKRVVQMVNHWSLSDDLVDKCDGIEDTPDDAPINTSDGRNYSLIVVVLLLIACMLLPVIIAVN